MSKIIIPTPAGPECDSGLKAPQSLLDGVYAYGVTACGFVARAPQQATLRGESTAIRDAMDEHYQQVHPEQWRQMKIDRSISAD